MAAFGKAWNSRAAFALYLFILVHQKPVMERMRACLGYFNFSVLLHITEVEGEDHLFCGEKSMG